MLNYQRVVILKEKAAERYLPIWIGPAEADAIAVKLQDVAVPRPLTHDLLQSVIDTLGASIDSIVVCDLKNDTFYAKKAKTSSTGNSSRTSMKLPPGVGASNLSIEPGGYSLKDMLREAWSGLYITELVGVHTADPVSGDFSFGITGRRINRGKLDLPVRGMAVSGNLFELFRGVKCVGTIIVSTDHGVRQAFCLKE
jgi:hypothetical protein